MNLDDGRIPALRVLLTQPDLPGECCDCPFAAPAEGEDRPNPADPGEGLYACALLGEEEVRQRNNHATCWTFRLPAVWGERPLCNRRDWQARAAQELREVPP